MTSLPPSLRAAVLFLCLAALLPKFSLAGTPHPMILDSQGVALVEHTDSGTPAFPYQALAAQLLEELSQASGPWAGQTIQLTLDARLQMLAEQALRSVGRGAVVMIDPSNGNILAMASVPSFDPAKTEAGHLPDDPLDPHLNRAISGFTPGAAFLPVTALAGALAGQAHKEFTCKGAVQFGDKTMKCWIATRSGTHGTLDLAEALKASCGPYFFQYGNAAGIEAFQRMGSMLGLGVEPRIPLKASAGILPGPEWLPTVGLRDEWSDGHTANTSIGQGYVLTTPLQMAMVAATIANDGVSYHPRLVETITGADVQGLSAQPVSIRADLRKEGISESDIESIRRGMWKTVNENGGTGQRAQIDGHEVAGRTGTAQFWRGNQKDNHVWFIGFAPYQNPRIAICVLVQGSKAGGAVAAPLAATILSGALSRDGLPVVSPIAPADGHLDFISSLELVTPDR